MAYTSAVVERTDEKVAELVDQFLNAVELPHGSDKPKLTIRSTGFMDITPTELFVRGIGGLNRIKEYSEMALLLQDLVPRPWMNLTGGIDAAYPFMHPMGWIQETKGGGQTHASPSQYASKLNALLGTGKLQGDTRTSGSFDGSKAGTVNLQIIGSIHWLILIHLERGNFGVYVAGEATKRYSELPSNFALPDCVRSRWTWLPLTSRLATAFGWDKFYQKSEAAATELSSCDDAENEASAAIGHRHVGPAGGYEVELRNGVILRHRFRQRKRER